MRAAVATLWAPDLRGGARFAWLLSGLVALLLLWEAPRQPLVVLLVPLAGIAVVLATRSPAWPLGVATGATLISMLAAGNLPKGGTVAAYTAWLLLGLVVAMIRSDRVHPPLRLVLDFSAAARSCSPRSCSCGCRPRATTSTGSTRSSCTCSCACVPFVVGVVVGFVRRDLELFFRVYVAMAVAAALYNTYPARHGRRQPAVLRPLLARRVDRRDRARAHDGRGLADAALLARARADGAHAPAARLALAPVAITFVSSGSRGPVIGMVVALPSVLLWRAASPAVAKRLALSLVAVGALAVVAVVALVPPEATQRSLSIFQTTRGGRRHLALRPLGRGHPRLRDNLTHTLVGIGTGGYAAISTHGALYPHNIVLEVGSELGVIGLLALAAFVISVIVRLLGLLARGGEDAGWSGLLLTLFVFSLVNAQFSGDVPYNEGLWLWGGLASGLAAAARAGSHYQPGSARSRARARRAPRSDRSGSACARSPRRCARE